MATITFGMSSTPLTGSKVFTGTDADMQDLLNWAAVTYASTIQQLFNTPSVPGFVPTNTQIGVALATATMTNWKAAVSQMKNTAAANALTPFNPTWA